MTVLEADEQHDDGNDGVEDGNLNPCLLGVTQTGNQREGYCGDDHVAEGGHAGTEQVDNGALVGITGHQGCQRCIREVQCGVNNGGAEVISNENVNALYDRRSRRNGEQQDCRDAVRNHHPEDPCTGLAVLGMRAVNQVTDQYVGNTIEETREQHDGTDHCCGDADYVGVEVNQQRGCQGVDNVTGNVAEAVGKLFFEMDLLKFLITRESRVAGFAHGFAQSFFIFLFCQLELRGPLSSNERAFSGNRSLRSCPDVISCFSFYPFNGTPIH